MYRCLLVIALCLLAVYAKNEEYEGHSLYEVRVQTREEVDVLVDVTDRFNLDIWTYPLPDREGLVLVPRDLKQAFQIALYEAGIYFKIAVQNIKEFADLEEQRLAEATADSSDTFNGSLSFDTIHRYGVVDQYMVDLAERYPDLVKVVSAGKSFEGRDIKYLKISTTNFEDTSKPVIILQSLLHAREWVTLPATLYAIKKLVIDVTDRDLVENVDWVILPIANPDGYEYSHTTNRFWRKNRATGFMPGDVCMGVDLNRNFDVWWGSASSSNPCWETFHGRAPFSEPESQVVREVLFAYRSRLEAYMDIHSFGSMILYGFGNGQLPPNALVLNVVAWRMAQAIDAVKWPQHRDYIVGNIRHVLYAASGVASDYAQFYHAQMAFTYELPAYRMTHGHVNGFLVEPEFIEQAGYETWEGIKTGVRWILEHTRARNQNKS